MPILPDNGQDRKPVTHFRAPTYRGECATIRAESAPRIRHFVGLSVGNTEIYSTSVDPTDVIPLDRFGHWVITRVEHRTNQCIGENCAYVDAMCDCGTIRRGKHYCPNMAYGHSLSCGACMYPCHPALGQPRCGHCWACTAEAAVAA